jgi:hypothetical protein
MKWKAIIISTATCVLLVAIASTVQAQTGPDADYIAKVMPAAPQQIVKGATIVAADKNGGMRTVQHGTNGFTCMLMPDGTPMCTDKNGMAWVHALMTHNAPPANEIGFMYMLAGDNGASNTDPYAAGPTSSNHWVKTGPHIMIMGPAAMTLGYPTTPDADATKPYVMWAGTPYQHVMIPVSTAP